METDGDETLEKSPLLKSYKSYSLQTEVAVGGGQPVNLVLGSSGQAQPTNPISLRSKIVSDEQMRGLLKECKAGNVDKVRAFYQEQNELIDSLLALDLPELNRKRDALVEPLKVRIAIVGSFIANLVLFSLELAATILSRSQTLLATTLDAFMDILSSAILLVVNWRARKARLEAWRYPVGPGRFQTAGVIVFGTLMSTMSIQILLNAVQTLLEGEPKELDLGFLVILFMGIALLSKSCLLAYCHWVARNNPVQLSSVTVLAQDHRNDILLTSMGLILSILGDHVNGFVDPVGALLIALFILRSWSQTVLHQCQLLVGLSGLSLRRKALCRGSHSAPTNLNPPTRS